MRPDFLQLLKSAPATGMTLPDMERFGAVDTWRAHILHALVAWCSDAAKFNSFHKHVWKFFQKWRMDLRILCECPFRTASLRATKRF